MASMEQVRRVEAVRAQRYDDWHASVQYDARLEDLAQLQEQEALRELNRLQTKLARPLGGKGLDHASEDLSGVLIATFSAGTLADNFTTYAEYPTPEVEPQSATLPRETRQAFGAMVLPHEIRVNRSTPALTSSEVYSGYATL